MLRTNHRDLALGRRTAAVADPALTLLKLRGLHVTEAQGDGSHCIGGTYLFWPANGYWRAIGSTGMRGYGVDKLLAAIATPDENDYDRSNVIDMGVFRE